MLTEALTDDTPITAELGGLILLNYVSAGPSFKFIDAVWLCLEIYRYLNPSYLEQTSNNLAVFSESLCVRQMLYNYYRNSFINQHLLLLSFLSGALGPWKEFRGSGNFEGRQFLFLFLLWLS